MAIMWRQLLDAIGVRWVDRGPNTARGHVNVTCPWCAGDPSFHLGIDERTGAYFCLRSQPPHAGRSTPYLLMALGVAPFQIDALLRQYSDDAPPAMVERAPVAPGDWEKFRSAADHPVALQYLRSRGIDPPAVIARKYDMRFAVVGRHSWRVLLPLQLNHDIVGWTGRAVSDRMDPRYLTHDPSGGASLYVPVYPTERTEIVQIVEGPFDAVAITDAYPQHEVVAVAVLGLNIQPQRLQHLADLISDAPAVRVLVTLDDDQLVSTSRNFTERLARGTGIHYPENYPLPPRVKDAGTMSAAEIRAWHDR